MTDVLSDYAVDFLKQAVAGDKPFFLYAAYIAPHWPLHARDETIEPYRERYRAQGWNEWRQTRIERQRELGLLPDQWTPAPLQDSIPEWSDVPHKDWQAERMAVYAAQISNVDRGVGRLLDVLRESGQAENTLVMILSDNGAAPNGGLTPSDRGFGFAPEANNSNWRKDGVSIKPGSGPDLLPGPHDTFAGYGMAWASTSNVPFRDHKQSAYEGGIRTPLIVHWPDGITSQGELTRQPGHVIDIMATCLDVADVRYPAEFQGRHPLPMEGISLVPILRGRRRAGHESLAWKCGKGRAIQMQDWKLVRPHDSQPWELYNLRVDGGETNDLAEQYPDRVQTMTAAYQEWRKRVGAQ